MSPETEKAQVTSVGRDIDNGHFDQADFDRFGQHMGAEMELLREWFSGRKFAEHELECGLEVEAWIIDPHGKPVPDNSRFLATLDRKGVVPELSKFNFELNVAPQLLSGSGLRSMRSELRATWDRCEKVADKLRHRILAIGILPTLEDGMLCIENMSSLQRYAALNEQVLRLRGGAPIQLEIEGEDSLSSSHQDLMLESAATSIQVHLKVPQSMAAQYYNASVAVSAITVGAAANAPLLFGKLLWDDTRIPLFEQAVDTAGPAPRVSFGTGYVEQSLMELFESNLTDHRILLPANLDEPPARMPYVRMHNGTIWKWNRPLIGFEKDGQPHLRIEHRPMSASPSMADLFADMALYLGLTLHLVNNEPEFERLLDFETARDNFYLAAQLGLNSQIEWLDQRRHTLSELLGKRLIGEAFTALSEHGLEPEFSRTCRKIIEGRAATRQNGAAWQRRKFVEYSGDCNQLLGEYMSRQATNLPIHTWG